MRELKIRNISWISLANPTAESIKALGERFPQIHPLILEELETPTIRPRVEVYDHHIYMVMHFPSFLEDRNKTVSHEVDFIILQDTLITVHYDELPILEAFWNECQSDQDLRDQYGKSPIHLLYYLVRQFFAFSLKELDQIQERIDILEDRAFSGKERETLEDTSILKRNIIDFRRAVKPQQLTLESLMLQGTQLFGEKVRPFLADLIGEYMKVWNLLENHKETLDALYETNNSLLTHKINEIMRVFTILAFISFIPTAIANIYGMNIVHIPLAERQNAFWAVLTLMATVTLVVYFLLKRKNLV